MPEPVLLPPRSYAARRFWNALNTFLGVIAVLAVIVMINFVAGGHFMRFETDRDESFKLTGQTKLILQSLTNDVNITVFFSQRGPNEAVYGLTMALLKEYQSACPRYIHVTPLDYDLDPGAAKEFLKKYIHSGLTEKDMVFFESGGVTSLVFAKELSNYDLGELMAGRSRTVRRNAFLGEMRFTEKIYDVSYPQHLKAYFIYGHGENDPDDEKENEGYAKFASVLKTDFNCAWEKLSLEGTNEIPADCSLLVLPAGARQVKIMPEELGKIGAWLKQDGRLMALLTVRSGVETVLKEWGVVVGPDDNRVMDMNKRFRVSDTSFVTARMATNIITDPLLSQEIPLLMVGPRSLEGVANQGSLPGAPQVTMLAATSDQGMDASRRTGSFNLLASVEQGTISGVDSAKGRGTRIVVAGDSYFLDNQVIDTEGNRLFAHQALGWLLQQPKTLLSGIGPRPVNEYRLYMTRAESGTLALLLLVAFPGAVLAVGGLVWLRRRS